MSPKIRASGGVETPNIRYKLKSVRDEVTETF
jgi:hypothetical protein